MRADPAYRKVTVDEFLSIDFGSDRKFELVDGIIQMMAGGSRAHTRVSSNILGFLKQRLRGSGCIPYNADAGLKISETNLRYPDVAVYCDEPPTPDTDELLTFEKPKIIFEVLSPSTQREDKLDKLEDYRDIASVDTIVLVDPISELTRVVQRLGENSWRDDLFAQPHDVFIPALNLTIPHAEIFARD